MAVGNPGVPTPLSMICLEDGFAALDSTTTLPYSGQYDLGSEETIYTNGSDQAYGTLLKVDLAANTLLDVSFEGVNSTIDTDHPAVPPERRRGLPVDRRKQFRSPHPSLRQTPTVSLCWVMIWIRKACARLR